MYLFGKKINPTRFVSRSDKIVIDIPPYVIYSNEKCDPNVLLCGHAFCFDCAMKNVNYEYHEYPCRDNHYNNFSCIICGEWSV